jgi:hypothetical protein
MGGCGLQSGCGRAYTGGGGGGGGQSWGDIRNAGDEERAIEGKEHAINVNPAQQCFHKSAL